jgi:hypothetical protein
MGSALSAMEFPHNVLEGALLTSTLANTVSFFFY